jgi:predicted negative regulator of RcsB-dependent stress response
MTFDHEEQEKVEAIKAWWHQYGNSVLLGLAVFMVGVAGVQGWRWYQRSQAEQAAALYAAVEKSMFGKDAKKVKAAAGEVMGKFPATAYAARAALAAARSDYEAGDMTGAKTSLQWAAEHASEDELRDVARLRLAGILLDEKKYAEALKTVDAPLNPAYAALFSDMKGDVLAADGKSAEARAAYQAALEKLGPNSQYRGYIQLKLDSLGG